MSSGAPGDKHDRYDPVAVDRSLRLAGWLNRTGLSDALYFALATPLYVPYFVVTRLLNRTVVHGKERLPPRGQGFFLLSNHTSNLDGQLLAVLTYPRTYWFPSKAAFYRSTVRGLGYGLLTAFKTFPVRRGERDMRAVELMEQVLRDGQSVLLFPEGTRSRDGELGRGRKGVGMIIHDTQPPVVCAYIEGLSRVLRPGRVLPGLGHRIDVVFGRPLELDDLFARSRSVETSQLIADRVMDEIAALRRELHAERQP